MMRAFLTVLASVLLATAACAADSPARTPLSAAALGHCAQQVLALRSESARLNQRAAQFNARRKALAARRARLDEKTADEPAHDRWLRYQSDAAAFNKEIAEFRQQVAAVNRVRQAYAAQCANRPYRQADLAALPQDAQAAMRAGLADVRVPTTGGR